MCHKQDRTHTFEQTQKWGNTRRQSTGVFRVPGRTPGYTKPRVPVSKGTQTDTSYSTQACFEGFKIKSNNLLHLGHLKLGINITTSIARLPLSLKIRKRKLRAFLVAQ